MEEVNEPKGQEQTEINIGNDPVMLTAVDVVSKLMNQDKVIFCSFKFYRRLVLYRK